MLTGIVQEVINNGVGKGSGLKIDGHKYGCFDPVKTGLDLVAVGDEVTFDWVQKGQYKNINGGITKTGNTGTPTASPSPKANTGGGTSGGGDFQFPIPALNYQRSVVRRDAVTQAVNLIARLTPADHTLDLDPLADLAIQIARKFEEYETGDDVEKAANEAIAKMNAATE
jgi:hypothetical protein